MGAPRCLPSGSQCSAPGDPLPSSTSRRHVATQAWSKASAAAWLPRQATGEYLDRDLKQDMGLDAETDTFVMIKQVSSSTFQASTSRMRFHTASSQGIAPFRSDDRGAIKQQFQLAGSTTRRKVEEKKKVPPEKHHMHRAAPALFAPTTEVVVHVVTRRRLHQLKEPCVNQWRPSTRAIVSKRIGDGVLAFTRDE